MTPVAVAGLYIGINLLILLVLAWNVISGRRASKVGFGDGGDESLARRIRVHANATEWVPGMLIGLLTLALLDANIYVLHALGIALTLARVLHAFGLTGSSGVSVGRFGGALISLLVYLAGGIAILWYALT
ncbi:MAG TPA: glutathione S-transferase [Oceanicaulis sp.]|jgi:uncharacterized membrane protein YecN with MAPEG domain|uniref:Glutathione S-transferase n=1 Tax=Glycocaulis albus TaxID=1382801 RepID=A0ABQ1XXA8_9PROT|nr:MAPEG family protein [Glycocaulis albus]MBV5259315.1 hypothetical protein [Synechococcus moorigangaii CMS01]GGH05594.1 hypothetical protein GCM10007420_22610 [Glycocaulis albus]HCY55618.1 glutathione S-transferase [Oceanicaulis sp.]